LEVVLKTLRLADFTTQAKRSSRSHGAGQCHQQRGAAGVGQGFGVRGEVTFDRGGVCSRGVRDGTCVTSRTTAGATGAALKTGWWATLKTGRRAALETWGWAAGSGRWAALCQSDLRQSD
jgi:hypothetical protein